MKRLLSLVLSASMALTMAACGAPSSQTAPDSSGDSHEPVTIEFWSLGLQPTFTDYINGVIEDFQDENDWITVKWVDLPWDGYQEKIIASIGANKAPDVINVWTTLEMSLAGNGALLNLSETAPDLLDAYQESLLKSNTMQGNVYGIPWYVTPPVCTYNTALFEQAGFENPPKDTNEMFEMAKTFHDKTGAYLYYPNELAQVLYFNGIELLNEDMTAAAFNTEETVQLLEKYQTAVREGYMPKENWGNWDEEIKAFAQNKLGMINLGAQTVTRLQNEAPNVIENTDVAAPMVGTAGIEQGALQSLVIPANSKNQEAALLFVEYMTNDANLLAFCKQAAIMPSTKTAAADPFFTSDTETLEGRARALSAEASAVSFDLGLPVEKGGEITLAISRMYESIILADKDIQSVLDATEQEVNELLK